MSPIEDVPELRQLVERVLAQDGSDARDARVVLHLEQQARALVVLLRARRARLSAVVRHRAELQDAELAAVATDAGLAEEDRAAVVELDQQGDERRRRERSGSARARDRTMSIARFSECAPPSKRGISTWMSGRPSTGRSEMRGPATSASRLGEDELGGGALEVPAQTLDEVGVVIGAARDDDRVGARQFPGVHRHEAHPAEDGIRAAVDDDGVAVGVGGRRPDHV